MPSCDDGQDTRPWTGEPEYEGSMKKSESWASGLFWAWNTSNRSSLMPSNQSSVHGENNFGPKFPNGSNNEASPDGSNNLSARRGLGWSISLGSMLWDWKGKSPAESREPSLHGGHHFR